MKPYIVFQGPIENRSGYGDHARDLIKALIKSNKYDIDIISTRWGDCPMDALSDNKNLTETEAAMKGWKGCRCRSSARSCKQAQSAR